WDEVRNYQARNNLAAMQVGDEAFFYHSREGLEIVGICTVSVAGITDPTDETGKWAAVKVKPKRKFAHPVTLVAIKVEPRLADMQLIRQSRLSVSGVTPAEWQVICEMAER
ncbi:MAG: EVE domain-containing protein, partial [Erythrobacter sp.]|nr:EVE domain-containing protein [Erythrobacter sp.]